ncbi:uncharacterized protein EV420DRAFT_1487954 [Desarmillaria tabescens]|uniref:Uncharacterized protein n=1 Tax=Armillaria tabescens TaxID=1929756 RepID=A0AA39J5F4_ARMTA|nr:uncharacterized protein EV420DRAFT_1487954 [Desarmillaria tabescens]KAK0435581.1 hypothetical protein EV420DRAFT_1487954 [Desarmillaria tabescens]
MFLSLLRLSVVPRSPYSRNRITELGVDAPTMSPDLRIILARMVLRLCFFLVEALFVFDIVLCMNFNFKVDRRRKSLSYQERPSFPSPSPSYILFIMATILNMDFSVPNPHLYEGPSDQLSRNWRKALAREQAHSQGPSNGPRGINTRNGRADHTEG